MTALHRAAYCGHLSVVQTLLRYKADAGLKDSDGHTPLHKASSEQCLYYKITLLFNYRQQQEVITVVAEVLVTALPSLVGMSDERGQLPANLVKEFTSQWKQLLELNIQLLVFLFNSYTPKKSYKLSVMLTRKLTKNAHTVNLIVAVPNVHIP